MARTKGPAYKMKSAAHGGPMRRNFPSAFKKEKMTKAEMQAASLAAAEKTEGITVSGGKKTKPGTFVQYSTEGGGESRGASIAGSSKRHTKLRDMEKDKNYKMTDSERAELRDLDVKTGKAYFRDTGGS